MSLRGTCLIAAVALLLVLPRDRAWVSLVLFVAAARATTPPDHRPEAQPVTPVVALGRDLATVVLLRRTVPELRMRRPAGAIDAQTRWRQAVEAGRHRRAMFS